MSPKQRAYLFGQSCVGAAIANAVINGAIGWGITRGLATFPLWRIPGVATDLAATAFGVAFGTCACMAVQVPWDLKRAKIAPLDVVHPRVATIVGRFPRGTFARGLGLGILSIAIFALPVVLALAAFDLGAMESGLYIGLKASFAAVQGALITPLIVVAALADSERRRAAPAASTPS